MNDQQHDRLLNYIRVKLTRANQVRAPLIDIFKQIDQDYNAYTKLKKEDVAREKANKNGEAPKPIDHRLALMGSQIDDRVTYLMDVIAPRSGIYQAVADKDNKEVARAFSALMNDHAENFDHYSEFERAFKDMCKYNMGGFKIQWASRNESVPVVGAVGIDLDDVEMVGNNVTAVDMYNILWDTTVELKDVPYKGEFVAEIKYENLFNVERKKRTGEYELKDDDYRQAATSEFYKARPFVRSDMAEEAPTDGTVNWFAEWGGKDDELNEGVLELWDVTMFLDGREFGLKDTTVIDEEDAGGWKLWSFKVLGGKYIVNAVPLNYAHNQLPYAFSTPANDGFDVHGKSTAELLRPLQDFASMTLNQHQRAVSKKIIGLTFYDPNRVNFGNMSYDDMAGGRVPVKSLAQGERIGDAVMQLNDTTSTNDTMNNIASAGDMMQRILPTDMLKQVAGLERATQYQAAATVQSGSKRHLKFAKIINGHCMYVLRKQQMYNIMQNQTAIELVTDDGEKISFDPSQLVGTRLKFIVSDGLKGIDTMSLSQGIKDVIHMLLQNPQAAQQVDIFSLIDYYFTLMGDRTSFKEFRYKTPFDAMSDEEKNMAFQLLQQAMEQANAMEEPQPR